MNIFKCRRSTIALIGIVLLAILGYTKGMDVGGAIASITIGVSAANGYEGKRKGDAKEK